VTPRRLVLAVGVGLAVGLVVVARLRYPGAAPAKLSAGNCNSGLWRHVYRPERLRVIEPCTSVDGRVVSVGGGSDGDRHILLDPDRSSVLNLVNATHGGGNLVVEVICDHTPSEPDAAAACAEFISRIDVPRVGDRIRATGAYVTDRDNGWNEIHPVSRIETLR
jgi:hypothetical protein